MRRRRKASRCQGASNGEVEHYTEKRPASSGRLPFKNLADYDKEEDIIAYRQYLVAVSNE
jgi:hypothetical protein